jgi:concentrative nucleoside transporter, CNT family
METFVHVVRGLIGVAAFVGLATLFSSNRKAIPWRLVGAGMVLQVAIAFAVLHLAPLRVAVEAVSRFFVAIMGFSNAGAEFLFGKLVDDQQAWGYLFAFKVLPSIVFFAAFTSLLYYLGILQKIVYVFAWIMSKTMKLSGAESLSASANIFIGQTEAPLLIKPYLGTMTRSELLCVMVGGMATIAGAVMVAYISFLGGPDPQQQVLFGMHLLTASVISAPAAVVAAKILLPQTEEVNRHLAVSRERIGTNMLDALANGTTDGLRLAVNVGAMLLVFTAMIALVNYLLTHWVGDWTGLNGWLARVSGGAYPVLTLQAFFGYLFAPLAWLMGVDSGSLLLAGQVIGEKTILNEFFAYTTLGRLKASGAIADPRAVVILTYALCGFSNISSIGIQIGGIGALAPNQRPTLAALGVKALIGGSIACFLTACVAAMLT